MAEAKFLKEDDYLSTSVDVVSIVFHPNLNVILVFSESGEVRVIDVHSGGVLHSCSLRGESFFVLFFLLLPALLSVARNSHWSVVVVITPFNETDNVVGNSLESLSLCLHLIRIMI